MGIVLVRSLTLVVTTTLEIGAGQTYTPRTYVLDFTKDKRAAATSADVARALEAGAGRQLPGSWEAGAQTIPFEITLVELDRPVYAIGDRVFFEATLKHVGTEPFAFPWSRSTARFDGQRPITRRAVILLAFTDDMLGSQLIGDENTTYAGDSVPDTFLVLRPGDTVRIRAHGQWFLVQGMARQPYADWIRNIAVRAQLQVHGAPGVIPEVTSAKAIQVQLQQRR